MQQTDLTISIAGLPPYSARGCEQTLIPIKSAEMHRTVNGELISTISLLHHKYKTMIKGRDLLPIAFDRLWKGQDIIIGSIQYLWQKAKIENLELDRDPVPGSVIAIDDKGKPLEVIDQKERYVVVKESGFVGYRPRLKMKVTDFGYETEEWGKREAKWFLALEEI